MSMFYQQPQRYLRRGGIRADTDGKCVFQRGGTYAKQGDCNTTDKCGWTYGCDGTTTGACQQMWQGAYPDQGSCQCFDCDSANPGQCINVALNGQGTAGDMPSCVTQCTSGWGYKCNEDGSACVLDPSGKQSKEDCKCWGCDTEGGGPDGKCVIVPDGTGGYVDQTTCEGDQQLGCGWGWTCPTPDNSRLSRGVRFAPRRHMGQHAHPTHRVRYSGHFR
jgi:hypothetical protein